MNEKTPPFNAFVQSLENDGPLSKWPLPLRALWYDAKGDWETAHRMVDSAKDQASCWVHAYLHRKEGDAFNASYWYRRSGRPVPMIDLIREQRQIAEALLRELR